jgi:hypothetical protein
MVFSWYGGLPLEEFDVLQVFLPGAFFTRVAAQHGQMLPELLQEQTRFAA